MTKPAACDVADKARSEPLAVVAEPAIRTPPEQRLTALPQPLPGLARASSNTGAGHTPGRSDPGTTVVRLQRQAGRSPGLSPPVVGERTRTLDELHRRAGQPPPPAAGPLVVRRTVVTQLKLGGERGIQVTGVGIVGRPPNTFGSSMGDHTTAFTVHVNAVQHALNGAPLAEAAGRLDVLVSELRSLPGYLLATKSLPDRHLALWQAALATITDVRRRIAAGSGDLAGLVQQYVGAYLELRELVPLSTINTGLVSKATSGKGKGEGVEALRDQAAGRPRKPEELVDEVLGLFDAGAAAVACAETDPERLAALAPGLPAGLDPRERGRLIVLQHLRSIQTGYPGALAALGGERVEEVSGSSGDAPAALAAAQRKAAQDADHKVLGRLIEEILRSHVLPRTATAVLGELDALRAAQARDVVALSAYESTGGDRALNSGKTGQKADEDKKRITTELTATRARIEKLNDVLSKDSVFAAKSGSPSAIGKAKPAPEAERSGSAPAAERGAGMGASAPAPMAPNLAAGRTKRKREAPGASAERDREREQQRLHDQALLQAGKKSARRPGPSSDAEPDAHGGKRPKPGAPEIVGKGGRKEPARPAFSGSDPIPEAQAVATQAPATPPRQTVQVVLDRAGSVAEIRFAGRPASPFPAAMGMGAHTTAWTVHLDRVRAALVGKNVAAAVAELEGPLQREREASAAQLRELLQFRHAVPAATPVAAGAPSLTRLQELVVSHLEQINLIPGATLPAADTGGKSEGRHREVLRTARKHPPHDVRTAVLGMLDLASLVEDTAKTELSMRGDPMRVLIRQHLAAIGAAYPDALPRARIDPRNPDQVTSILEEITAREPGGDSGKAPRRRPAAKDGAKPAAQLGRPTAGPASLSLDDSVFGKHLPPAEPSLAPGRPESAPEPLLGSAGALVLPSEADRAAAALWLDPEGNLIEDRLAQFTTAYTEDLADAGTYLAEGEGTVAARYFRVRVRVYRDQAPAGFDIHANPGGGDCLLYALNHVAQAANGQPLSALTGDQITAARAAVVAGLPPEAARNAARAIVTDAVAQRHVAGLGRRLTTLLTTPGFWHAAAWVRTGRQRLAAEALLKARAERAKAEPVKAPSVKAEPVAPKASGPAARVARAIQEQAIYGEGVLLADQALLHTGGNHYVALTRRRVPPGRPAGSSGGSAGLSGASVGPSGSSGGSAGPPGGSPSSDLPLLTTLSAPVRVHLPH